MRQNVGLFLLTLGSVLLSVKVFWGKMVDDWEGLSWEQRWFYRLTGGRRFLDFERQSKMIEEAVRRQEDKDYGKRMKKREKRYGRLVEDLPIFALVLMIIGFFLTLNYSAF